MINALLILLANFVFVSAYASPTSFRESKKLLSSDKDVWSHTFYCGCDVRKHNGKLIPDLGSCGVSPRKNEERASRIEWDHVMPAHFFGHHLPCWTSGGRKECSRNDSFFKAMEGDLHNLVPAIGEINGDRSNFAFGEVVGEERRYGHCDIEIHFAKKLVEPRTKIRGDVARIYLYMSDRYSIPLNDQQARMFEEWSRVDPVSDYECNLNWRKAKLQGWVNPFVSKDCQGEFNTGRKTIFPSPTFEINYKAPIQKLDAPTTAGGKEGALLSEGQESDDIF